MREGRPMLEIGSWIAGILGTVITAYLFFKPAEPPQEKQIVVNAPPAPPIHLSLIAPPGTTVAQSPSPAFQQPTNSGNDAIPVTEAPPPVETPQSTPTVTFEPSFDCNRATTHVEIAICHDAELSALDKQLSVKYKAYLASNPGSKIHIKTAQIEWLKESRGRCEDKDCIAEAYRTRIAFLSSAIE